MVLILVPFPTLSHFSRSLVAQEERPYSPQHLWSAGFAFTESWVPALALN